MCVVVIDSVFMGILVSSMIVNLFSVVKYSSLISDFVVIVVMMLGLCFVIL